jgi:hypothetical protein
MKTFEKPKIEEKKQPIYSSYVYVSAGKTFKFTFEEFNASKPRETDSFAIERTNMNVAMISYCNL